MKDNYQPELGQMMFGQPSQELECPEWLEAYLWMIDTELSRVMWNVHQEEWDSPFSNTGNSYKNDTFEVEAYSWDDETPQPFNFKWKDIQISWYKHCGRGMSVNKKVTHKEGERLLNACLKSIRKQDVEI